MFSLGGLNNRFVIFYLSDLFHIPKPMVENEIMFHAYNILSHFDMDLARDYLSHGLSVFHDVVPLDQNRNILIVGSGIATVYLLVKGFNSYKKAQRRY